MPNFRFPFFYNSYYNRFQRPFNYNMPNSGFSLNNNSKNNGYNFDINNSKHLYIDGNSQKKINTKNHFSFTDNRVSDNFKETKKTDCNEDDCFYHKSNESNKCNSESEDNYFFELFGLKLYFDDILLICIIFFLYEEGVKDQELFLSLILLLLT